jgi:hypothetical protein
VDAFGGVGDVETGVNDGDDDAELVEGHGGVCSMSVSGPRGAQERESIRCDTSNTSCGT